MDVAHILKAICFLTLETVGIPGNFIILASFLYYRIFIGKFMPVDMMLSKLSFINLVVVLFRGIPQSIASVGIKNLFDQQGCNAILIIYRLFRAMSICVTSLLSCYQWAVIVPSSGFWDNVKGIMIHKLSPIMIFLWCMNFVIHLFTIYAFSWGLTTNSTTHVLNLDFCLVLFPSYSAFQISGTVTLIRDLIFIILMIISSLSIVIILYQHRQQVQSIRSSDQDQNVETRAAKAVLFLVLMYVIFFGLDNGIWLYTIFSSTTVSPELTFARVFFGSCYCALSPIVIIATNKKVLFKLKFASLRTKSKSSKTSTSKAKNCVKGSM